MGVDLGHIVACSVDKPVLLSIELERGPMCIHLPELLRLHGSIGFVYRFVCTCLLRIFPVG